MPYLATGRPPFRADHVGSLLRPPALKQAFRDHAGGRLSHADFVAAQDQAIREVIALQEACGLDVVTDGEFRRGSYWGRFVERTSGFAIKPALFKFRDDQGHETEFTATYAESKLARNQPLAVDEYEFLAAVTRACPKITLPAPSTMHFYRCTDFAAKEAYASVEAFFADIVAVFRAEIADFGRAGCRYVQLDEVALALLCDPAIRAKVEAAGQKPDRLIPLYIDAINACVDAAPAGMVFGVHMCRGNFKGRYLSQGGYEGVAEQFFSQTAVNHFLLEYDTPRAGDFRPLRFVKGKGVVLGLVSSKTPVLESLEELRRRTDEASRFVDLDRLAISPQCGFASTVAGNPLTEADERAKLKLCVEAARTIWG
jgi:5-methyltetrahydropteroyltriglutamate--homocysteine methyltransferase